MNIALITIAAMKNSKEALRITTIGLAEELINRGHEVYIITEHKEGLPKVEKIGKVTIYRLYNFPFLGKIISPLLTLNKLQKKKNVKFDIIHTISATPLFSITSIIAKIISKKSKTVHTLKSYSRDKKGNKGYFLLNFVDKVTLPTNRFAEKLKNVSKNKISILHSPIRIEKFQPLDKYALKKKHGYNNKVIFYYGSMHLHKGVDNLIKTIPSVIKNNPKIKFIFAPRYKDIEKETKLVESIGVNSNVKFITKDINLQEYVNMADLVVLPYKSLLGTEGNPSCLMESMACKTLVVTTNLPEIKELFENCAIFAEADNIESLAKKIIQGINQNNDKVIENAFKKVQGFSFTKITDDLEKIYFN